MTKSSNYWDKRALRRLTEAEKLSEEHIKRIKRIYEQAYRDVSKEIERTYKAYSKNTGLDVEKLKELLTKKETDKVWKTLKRQGLDQYIKNNYKARISRLEKVQAQIYAKAKMIYPKEELQNTMCYKGVINQSYYKSVYDTQMGTGYDFSFSKIDNNMTNLLLNEKWSGLNYSQRIWKNTDYLAESLAYTLGGAMLSGQSIEKTTRQIRERFRVSKYYAERLVRTETNHFNNEADAMAYEQMGVKKYVFVATLDSRTSAICQSHDNKVYNFKDKEVGVNYPPLHPNCRSKTRGYISEEVERTLKRRARNPQTGKTEIIDNMSYKEWAEKNGLIPKEVKPKKITPKTEVKNEIKPLTKDQKEALEYYVSGEGMYINNFLRSRAGVTPSDMLAEDIELVKQLDGATNRPVGDTKLYRSVDASVIFKDMDTFDYEDLRGYLNYGAKGTYETNKFNKLMSTQVKEFKDLGFVSTTKDYDIAKEWGGFTGSDKPIVLELNLDETVKGVDLDFLDIADDPQRETLLARNQVFKVKDVTAKDGNIYVKVDVTNGDVIKDTVKLADTPIKEAVKGIDKPVIKVEDLPIQMRASNKELNNAKILVDYINSRENADPKVAKVYGLMGKVQNKDFKISHAKDSSLKYNRNRYNGNTISDVKLTIPNLTDVNDIGNINTTLHENMHFIDFMSGNKRDKLYSSLNYQDLVDTIKNTDASMSDDIKKLFDEFNKTVKDTDDTIVAKYKPMYEKLNADIKDKKITYTEYKQEWAKVNKMWRDNFKEAEYEQRRFMGGGVNNLEDIYDALSRGVYRDSNKVRYGHGTKYYRDVDSRVKEIVANYGALSISRPDLIELLKADKPALVSELDKLMDSIINEYGG